MKYILFTLLFLTGCSKCLERKPFESEEYQCWNPVDNYSPKRYYSPTCTKKIVTKYYCSKYEEKQ